MFKTDAKLPVSWLSENLSEALSIIFLFFGSSLEIITNLVSLFFMVWILLEIISKPKILAASKLAIAAVSLILFSEICFATSAVSFYSTNVIWGYLLKNFLHCKSAIGWEETNFKSSILVPGKTINWWFIFIKYSPTIFKLKSSIKA